MKNISNDNECLELYDSRCHLTYPNDCQQSYIECSDSAKIIA